MERPAPAPAVLWPACIIAAAVVLTYLNSLSGPFVLDDLQAIVQNLDIREWWHPRAILLSGPNSPFTGRPLVNMSLAVNYAFGGLNVLGYHVWNIVFHACCALLLFVVVRRTLNLPRLAGRFGPRSTGLAFAAALIWAVHPLNSEVVDYTITRSESMMAVFYLLTLYACNRALRSPHVITWQAAAVAFCVLGMACKESMVTAPVMALLYDRAFAFDSVKDAFRARWRLYAGLAATWLLFAALLRSSRAGAGDFASGVTPWTYLLNQAIIIIGYLHLVFWPRALVAFYGWPLSLSLGDILPYALFIVTLAALTCVAWFKCPPLGFLGAWFFITLSPTSSIVPITTEVGAERRMYLPLMAVVVLVVVACVLLWDRAKEETWGARVAAGWASVVVFVVLGGASTALAAGTVARNREYASALSLARTVVERRPTGVAHHILGEQLDAAGDHDEGVKQLREAVALGDSRASYHLGLWLFTDGHLDESIAQLQAFVSTWGPPYHLITRWLEPTPTEVMTARTRMGHAYLMKKQWPQAAEQFRLVLEMSPSDASAHGLLGDALLGEEKFDEAAAQYREYLTSRPDDAVALTALGIALDSAAHPDDAIGAFRRAVAADPRNADAERDLAAALFDRHDAGEAVSHARRAVVLAPADPEAHDLLGRTLALQGSLPEARAEFERALQLDPAYTLAQEDLRRTAR